MTDKPHHKYLAVKRDDTLDYDYGILRAEALRRKIPIGTYIANLIHREAKRVQSSRPRP